MSELKQIGQYELLEQLGAGSAATVHRARHKLLGTEHALKLLELQNPSIAQRFMREGQVQARLRHPNIIPVTDLLQEGERVAMVMELVTGGTLEDRLYFEGPLPLSRTLAIFRQLLDAMGYAHQEGVMHRDIKPSNILMTGDAPRVADFGIASWAGASEKLTRAGLMMGTPGYMPPELWTDPASADARTDVFELGALLYEMISGRRPFMGKNIRETLDMTAQGQRPGLLELAPDTPDYVVAAVDRALRPDRTERFESCAAFAAALNDPELPAVIPPANDLPLGASQFQGGTAQGTRAEVHAEKYRIDPALPTLSEHPFGALPPLTPDRSRRESVPTTGRRLPIQSLFLVAAALLVGVVVYDPFRPGSTGSPMGGPALNDEPIEDVPVSQHPVIRPSKNTGGSGTSKNTTPATCKGWIYATVPAAPKVGDILPLGTATSVRADYPHEGAAPNPATVCTLPAGAKLKISQAAVHMVGDHYWIPVSPADVVAP